MASTGRGRGRGRGLLTRELPKDDEVRPGPAESGEPQENGTPPRKVDARTRQESVSEIEHIMETLTLDVSENELNNLYHLAENVAHGEEDVRKVTEIIYAKFTSDREFSKTGALICDKLASLEVNGTKFRSLLLSMVQKDYKDKDELRSKSISKYLNNLSFMSQIFGTMRTAGGEVFKPLVGPLYECFNIIIDSQECDSDEFECLNEQIQSIGRDLEQNDREQMEQIMTKLRSKIIRNGSTQQIRCILLEIIECYNRGWKDLSNDVTRFYCDTMMDILTD